MRLLIGILFAFLSSCFAQVSPPEIPPHVCKDVTPMNYVRNVNDCTGWIRCRGTESPVFGNCPSPYYFDQTGPVCTYQDSVNCFECPKLGLSWEPVEGSCNRFIRCTMGTASEEICPDNLQFNPVTQCDLESNVKCVVDAPCPAVLPPGTLFTASHDPTNCSIGVVCIGVPEPITIPCNPELHFNIETLMCDWPENAKCPITTTDPTPPNASSP